MGRLCKYKEIGNPFMCQVLHGYCQFQRNGYESGLCCPIYANYVDFDKYWIESNTDKNGLVKLGYIIADDYDPAADDAFTNVLDIQI